ncbi:MAG TPA: hypothetical protein VGJ07_23605, partial [Rugosimonospora sp.]
MYTYIYVFKVDTDDAGEPRAIRATGRHGFVAAFPGINTFTGGKALTRKRRIAIALVSAGLLLGLGQPAWATPNGGTTNAGTANTGTTNTGTAKAGAANASRTVRVTLLTGDRVTVAATGPRGLIISPAKGREGMRFST